MTQTPSDENTHIGDSDLFSCGSEPPEPTNANLNQQQSENNSENKSDNEWEEDTWDLFAGSELTNPNINTQSENNSDNEWAQFNLTSPSPPKPNRTRPLNSNSQYEPPKKKQRISTTNEQSEVNSDNEWANFNHPHSPTPPANNNTISPKPNTGSAHLNDRSSSAEPPKKKRRLSNSQTTASYQCPGTTVKGKRCTKTYKPPKTHCSWHDPNKQPNKSKTRKNKRNRPPPVKPTSPRKKRRKEIIDRPCIPDWIDQWTNEPRTLNRLPQPPQRNISPSPPVYLTPDPPPETPNFIMQYPPINNSDDEKMEELDTRPIIHTKQFPEPSQNIEEVKYNSDSSTEFFTPLNTQILPPVPNKYIQLLPYIREVDPEKLDTIERLKLGYLFGVNYWPGIKFFHLFVIAVVDRGVLHNKIGCFWWGIRC